MAKYKEIFIFVSGSTPQIITETIYALAVKKPPIHPDEIIIITTFDGAKRAKEELENKGILKKLFEEYKIPQAIINYKVPTDKAGIQLTDIRTTEDNKQMADLITSVIKEKTEDKDNRLHCSIAGGRKTMSFYLGSALQLYGRTQDKLYHVLVTPEFESNKEFYYKPIQNQKIQTPDGKVLNTDDAEITLAEIPFVRLGEKTKITGNSYNDSVRAGQDAIDSAIFPMDVEVDLKNRHLKIGDTKIKLPPIHLTLYATMLKLKKDCKKKDCDKCEDCVITRTPWKKEKVDIFSSIYECIRPETEIKWFSGGNIVNKEVLTSTINKINSNIKKHLGSDALAQYYLIKSAGEYGGTYYYIPIDKKKIIGIFPKEIF